MASFFDLKNPRSRVIFFLAGWLLFWVFLAMPLLNNWIGYTANPANILMYFLVVQGLFYGSIYLTILMITGSLDMSDFSLGFMLIGTAIFVVLSAPQCISAPTIIPQQLSNLPVIDGMMFPANQNAVAGQLLVTKDNFMCYAGTDTLWSYVFHTYFNIEYGTNLMYYASYYFGALIMIILGSLIISTTDIYRKLKKIF